MIRIRPVRDTDTEIIVSLNRAVEAVTSPMDTARCRELLSIASYCLIAEEEGETLGFVLAMQQGDPYENGNFAWFGERLNNFIYIDRIVVADFARSKGLGKILYDHLAEEARSQGKLMMAAEMDLVPRNDGSHRFHARYGFMQLGTRELDSGKVVSMQAVAL
ncbi:MAG: GNAT family N-acetyltransferase [Sphingomonadaceae bacterium]|nr:GNAT family N-acetyltransferase [Sphingomonadaceae bacterium]